MSVANFDGDGYGDPSGIVYGYETDNNIRSLSTSLDWFQISCSRQVTPSYIYPLNAHRNTMAQSKQESITFSKKVDTDGRLVVPQEIRQALEIDGREALVEFDAAKVTYLEGGEDE